MFFHPQGSHLKIWHCQHNHFSIWFWCSRSTLAPAKDSPQGHRRGQCVEHSLVHNERWPLRWSASWLIMPWQGGQRTIGPTLVARQIMQICNCPVVPLVAILNSCSQFLPLPGCKLIPIVGSPQIPRFWLLRQKGSSNWNGSCFKLGSPMYISTLESAYDPKVNTAYLNYMYMYHWANVIMVIVGICWYWIHPSI